MKTLAIDIETYSSNNLKTCGVYKYTEAPDFEILLFAYSVDAGPVKVVDLACGEELPKDINHALTDPTVKKTAFNAQFERICIARYLLKILTADQWECSMVKGAMLGLPFDLDRAGKVLQVEAQKDATGKALIRYFCIPCKPTQTNGMRTRNMPWDDIDKWEAFKNYNVRDVETELAIREKISWFQIPENEQQLWVLDQKINDRGIGLDPQMIQNAIKIDSAFSEKLTDEASQLTGLDNPNSPAQLKRWISDNEDFAVDSLNKDVIPELIEKATNAEVKEMLALRSQMAKSSIKKYTAMMNCICSDLRAHGLVQFYGANRTGRWAGRLIQLQNLPRIYYKFIDMAREVVRDTPELFEMLYDNVTDILSQLIRTAFVPSPGHVFDVVDFSAIELIVIAWLAGEQWVIDEYQGERKIYEQTAARMLNMLVGDITKDGPERQKGKIASLACIAEGQKVLTQKGLVNIENITIDHKVWDGDRFVSHDGLLFKGYKKTITYDGLTATEDHLVWIENELHPVPFGTAAARGARLLRSVDYRRNARLGNYSESGKEMEFEMEHLQSAYEMQFMRNNAMDQSKQSPQRKKLGLSLLFPTKANTSLVGSKTNGGKTTLRKSRLPRISQLRRSRNTVYLQQRYGGRAISNRNVWSSAKRFTDRQNKQQWPLRERKSAFYHSDGERIQSKNIQNFFLGSGPMALLQGNSFKKIETGLNTRSNSIGCKTGSYRKTEKLEEHSQEVRVYDILNAGPKHRFTVSGVLVHNCQYQGGVGALVQMGALRMGLKEEELPDIITRWRGSNTKIVGLWSFLNNAAIEAVDGPGNKVPTVKGGYFQVRKNILFMGLPSGRELAYFKPELLPGKFGNLNVVYQGISQKTKNWTRIATYGGLFAENMTQAIARDLLGCAMQRLDSRGYSIVGHVHDETIIDRPKTFGSFDEILKLMTILPTWAKGLPLAADGFESEYYKK